MTGPYSNPEPGNKLRCPECGSSNAWCEEDATHHCHICDDCGYTGIFRGPRGDPAAPAEVAPIESLHDEDRQ